MDLVDDPALPAGTQEEPGQGHQNDEPGREGEDRVVSESRPHPLGAVRVPVREGGAQEEPDTAHETGGAAPSAAKYRAGDALPSKTGEGPADTEPAGQSFTPLAVARRTDRRRPK